MHTESPKPITLLSSGGKDSMAALGALKDDPGWRVERVLTTFNETNQRVAMHGVPRSLIQAQADVLGLELLAVGLPESCSNEVYEGRMAAALQPLIDTGLKHVAIGDLFLEDIRQYREAQFARLNLEAVFPIWKRDTRSLAIEMIETGWKAVICSVDAEQLDPVFLGRRWDTRLLEELPPGVDWCGENGEFHTFVFDGPLFRQPVAVRPGDATHISYDRFHMLDLAPA